MTGPRDMKPWEVYAYSRYRTNLRHTHGKPDTKKGRELHHLERWLYFWPMYAYIRWTQRKSRYPANTTQGDVDHKPPAHANTKAPPITVGAFLMPKHNPYQEEVE